MNLMGKNEHKMEIKKNQLKMCLVSCRNALHLLFGVTRLHMKSVEKRANEYKSKSEHLKNIYIKQKGPYKQVFKI